MDLLIPLALAALLIFFLFNSRRKQKARAEQIKSGLVPGATVMTTFGVFGTVLSIDEENNQVTIESGPGTVLRVHRQAIGQIDNPEAATAVDAPAADAPAADASAADAEGAAAETDGEKPAITDAELDAMNARKRAEKDSDIDSESTDVAESSDTIAGADDTAVEPADADSDVEASVSDESAAESDGADDAAEIDSDVDEADSTDSDTDKKN
ncbi:preprotein translocase subunit YajC [Brevibacterium oceani]|uniref:preprotein translocase subunit YajC n=1 Tax=Brevibacterium oceani TaxID=358099 RepID=UPI001FE2E332|nr:preprotein translocase subunit YajC [Brevibacterium oceani]